MKTAGRRRLRALSASLALLLLAGIAIAADPVYVRLLRPPVATDAIGYPRAVEADPETGEVFVADTRKNRILIFDNEGDFVFEIEGGRSFSSPTDLAVDRDGYLFVLANYDGRRTLIQLDFDGLFLREISVGLPGEIETPNLSSVAISPEGDRLYLVDRSNLVLWIADREGRVVGSVDLAEGIEETKRRDVILGHVDVYDERVVLAVPSAAEILLFNLDGKLQGKFGRKGTAYCLLGFPTAAAMDERGDLIVIDQQRMLIMRWGRADNQCISEHYGIGSSPGYLYFPMDISLDTAGRVYVSQGFGGRVQMYSGFPPASPLGERIGPERDENVALWAESREAQVAEERAAEERYFRSPEAVVDVLESWAEVRRLGRFDLYIDKYSPDFLSANAQNLEDWTRVERQSSNQDEWTDFEISEVAVKLRGDDLARATLQLAVPAREDGQPARVTLLLKLEETGWKIIEEWDGAPPSSVSDRAD